MGFTITEKNEGYSYKGNNYKWGEGLIQFVNYDFSKYFECIKSIRENANEQSIYDIKNNLSHEMEINKFYFPLIKFQTESLHINLQIDFLQEYTNQDDLKIKQDINKLDDDLYNCFFIPIKFTQSNYRTIISSILSEKISGINLNKTTILKINDNILHTETIFDKINMDFSYKSTLFSRFNSIKKIKSIKEDNIEYENIFYKVEDFCRYELYKVLENKINILKCPFCKKYFIQEHGNSSYCSPKCRKKANDEKLKNDPYYSVYNQKRKKILNSHYSFGQTAKDKDTQKDLKPLYDIYTKYKQPLDEKLNKKNYQKFLDEIKPY